MYNFPIGVLLESFRLPLDEALDKAAELGMNGIQIYATKGAQAPENLSASQRKELLDKIKSRGLVVSALCGDLGKGFTDSSLNPELVEKSKRILDLAKDLETNIVTTHIGVVPEDKSNPRYDVMQSACGELAEYADSLDAHFAIETGPEKAAILKEFLDGLHSKGVAVNLDPANFVMVTGDDPVQAVYTLKDYIVHTHAKDGKRLFYRDPEVVYGLRKDIIVEDESFIELPLGTGEVEFAEYLKALENIGFKGFLTIEREVGDDPSADIILARDYLKKLIG